MVGNPYPQRQNERGEQDNQQRQQYPANQPQDKQENSHRQSLPFQLLGIVVGFGGRLLLHLAVQRRQIIEAAQPKHAQKGVGDLKGDRLARQIQTAGLLNQALIKQLCDGG